jgi:hypothetical protein
MPETIRRANWSLGLIGVVVGGAIGYFGFALLVHEGYYGLLLPGSLLGLGCGALSGGRSNLLGLVCCALAALLGIFTEWRFFPFRADGSFVYFLAHLHDCTPTTLISMAAGGFFGFWFGRGREGGAWLRRSKSIAGPEGPAK